MLKKIINSSMAFITIMLFSSCGRLSEEEEFQKLAGTDLPSILQKAKPIDINYWAYVQDGKIDVEEAKNKEKQKIALCGDVISSIDSIKYSNDNNQKVWNSWRSSIEASCKTKEAVLKMVLETDPVAKEEAQKEAVRLSSLTEKLVSAYKINFTEACKKFDCGKYLKVQ